VATIDEAENTVQPAKATSEETALKVTGDDRVSTDAEAEMKDNLEQAGYE
jgi:hypothetical protein